MKTYETCVRCDGPTGVQPCKAYKPGLTICRECQSRSVEERRRTLERMWAEGWSTPDMYEWFGWSNAQLQREVRYMREHGYSLPATPTPRTRKVAA